MKNKKLKDKIVKEIKKDKIKPVPKWRVIFKEVSLWIVVVSGLIFGAVGLGTSLRLISFFDWDIVRFAHNPFLTFFVSLPIVWIVLIALSLFLAYVSVRKSERGYKPQTLVTVIGILALFLLLTPIFFRFRPEERIPRFLGPRHPSTLGVIDPRYNVWDKPQQGFLAGDILKAEEESFTLEDLKGNTWNVDSSEAIQRGLRSLKEEGLRVKVIGEETGEASFKAFEIRPWDGGRNMMQERPMHMRSIR